MPRKQRKDTDENGAPNTLLEAVKYFADRDVAHSFVAALRWPNGEVYCPRCESTRHSYLAARRVWKCLACKKQFSVKVGTIFEDSPLSLSKWLPAMWQLANCKNGISSYELARAIGVTQKTAWFMLARIRLAMQQKSFNKIGGEVEVDETYIGGKARNMHKSKRERIGLTQARSMLGKVAVMGLLERHGTDGHSQIRLQVVEGRKRSHFRPVINEHVTAGATINTDSHLSYQGLSNSYVHNVIDHAEKYVDGTVHTNGCENFWSLLKRAIKGTYVAVGPFICFVTLTSNRFVSTTARWTMHGGSCWLPRQSLANA